MKTQQLIIYTLALAALAACNRNEITAPADNDRVALRVTGGIQSRAIGNNWQANDAIGIYMLRTGTATISEDARNRRYTTADGNSGFITTADQTIYFPVDGSNVDFIAYYPQQTLTDGAFTINVSNQESLPNIDLMTAKVQSSEGEPLNKNNFNVAFRFKHRMTKLELNIEYGTGLTPENLEGLKVEITKQRTEASYTPLTETLEFVSDANGQSVTFNTAENGMTAEAILLPNSTDSNPIISGRELVFTLKATGETFRWAIPNLKEFKAGDRNIYNITINRGGLAVTATIENWNRVDNGRVEAE